MFTEIMIKRAFVMMPRLTKINTVDLRVLLGEIL